MAKRIKVLNPGPMYDCQGQEIRPGNRVYYIPEECTVVVSHISSLAVTGKTDEGMRYCMAAEDCKIIDATEVK